MNTQPEALRLAGLLETDGWPDAAAELRRLHEEIQALRQALAQPEQEPETVMAEYKFQTYAAYKVDGEMKIGVVPEPDQPEQEPVAWMMETPPPKDTERSVKMTSCEWVAKEWENPIPLYTAPPKREWVDLTQDDMPGGDNPIYDTDEFLFGIAWARAKLKEKNGG